MQFISRIPFWKSYRHIYGLLGRRHSRFCKILAEVTISGHGLPLKRQGERSPFSSSSSHREFLTTTLTPFFSAAVFYIIFQVFILKVACEEHILYIYIYVDVWMDGLNCRLISTYVYRVEINHTYSVIVLVECCSWTRKYVSDNHASLDDSDRFSSPGDNEEDSGKAFGADGNQLRAWSLQAAAVGGGRGEE